jgi:hypothetical protein
VDSHPLETVRVDEIGRIVLDIPFNANAPEIDSEPVPIEAFMHLMLYSYGSRISPSRQRSLTQSAFFLNPRRQTERSWNRSAVDEPPDELPIYLIGQPFEEQWSQFLVGNAPPPMVFLHYTLYAPNLDEREINPWRIDPHCHHNHGASPISPHVFSALKATYEPVNSSFESTFRPICETDIPHTARYSELRSFLNYCRGLGDEESGSSEEESGDEENENVSEHGDEFESESGGDETDSSADNLTAGLQVDSG